MTPLGFDLAIVLRRSLGDAVDWASGPHLQGGFLLTGPKSRRLLVSALFERERSLRYRHAFACFRRKGGFL